MSNVKLAGNVLGTGSVTIASPNTNSDFTIALPASNGTMMTTDTAVSASQIPDGSITAAKLANTTVTAGSYTYTSITVDAQGRLTAASSGASPSAFPSGTVMFFGQTTAPTGWTKDTTNYNNSALRVVTGSASTGGSVDFTTAFASQTPSGTVGSTTLSTAQMPAHTHPSGVYGSGGGTPFNAFAPADFIGSQYTTGSTGGGGSHTHSFTGTAINLAVKYVDVIRATKD